MTRLGIVVGGDQQDVLSVHEGYVDAVLEAGGHPVLLPKSYGDRVSDLQNVLARVDAVLLVGGGDIDCHRYGQVPETTLRGVDPVRDAMETHVVEWAMAHSVRVLGICRGAQVLAVATGGTLHQDLPAAGYHGHLEDDRSGHYAALRHEVVPDAGTLAAWLLDGITEVNSHHHQAICDPGTLVGVTGWSKDGTAEVVEAANMLGVQWHPELLFRSDRRHLRPFLWLVGGDSALVGN
jgi:putative glutamine amidotransferase